MVRTYDFVPSTGQVMDTENLPPPAFIPPVVELIERILATKPRAKSTGVVVCTKCRKPFKWQCIGLSPTKKPLLIGRCETPNCLRLMASPAFVKPTPAKRKAKRAMPGADE